ncbi:MAG: light-harvesting protein [Thiohalocapsa sp.]|jgi:light-harvesting complex 1 alpha chain|uniref:light-harvesting antenna LH1, alpha subunit n=1 Tax=Thiohalocapsa sp. TaxID=2497641 RepID=UPI0025FF835B|nr:light-harvesting antenna LH1, alpha subunit [Thiohalocapsa sp.]MCG6939967.1 light-harvesting protein [Thiohalocapsa sp.]
MHRIWQWYDPRRALMALFSFLFALALLIHFILLASPDFNWMASSARVTAPASNMTPMPPVRNMN